MGLLTGMGHEPMRRALALSVLVSLFVVEPVRAEELEYSDIDRATVLVLALKAVDTYEIEEAGQSFVFAAPVGGHGSGFAVTRDGLVVTAAHVVAGARALAVHVPGVMGAVPARVVHIDETRDVAFLSVRYQFSSIATLAEPGSKLKVRSEVFAVGYPLDRTRADPQSARGVLSGLLPDGRVQLSISLNPGNSGGPVIDSEDRVFGVVSARSDVKSGAIGLAAAVPLEAFRDALARFMQTPQLPPAGVEAQKVADLVSLVAHEGETVLRGAVRRDSPEAQQTDRRVRQLIAETPGSADAALVGAVFFWNRHVALRVHGLDSRAARDNAVKLTEYAVQLDPELRSRSKFVAHVLARRPSNQDAPLAEQAPTDTVGGAGALVTFLSDFDDVTLHVKLAESAELPDYVERTSLYGRICKAPCKQVMRAGNYRVALSKDGGKPVEVEGSFDVYGPVIVKGEYEDRSTLRALGWVLGIGGSAAGLFVASKREERCESSTFRQAEQCSEVYPNLGLGLGIAAGSALVGIILVTRGDQARLTVSPGVLQQPGQKARVGRERDALQGVTLSGTF